MSDIVRPYCDICEPDTDPIAELLELRRCYMHNEAPLGSEDVFVKSSGVLAGSAEAGSDGAAWARVLNRDSPARRRLRKKTAR